MRRFASKVVEEADLPPGAVTVFGYGSNMSPEGMASKGLTPLRSRRAILDDWKLSFNMRYAGLCDPAMANVEPCAGGAVHGVATTFTPDDLAKLDEEEICYERVTVPVRAYAADGGEAFEADVYQFTQAVLEARPFLKEILSVEEHPPGRRYLNLLTGGARKENLDEDYLAALEASPVATLPALAEHLTDAALARIGARRYTMDEVAASAGGDEPLCVLKGVVFTCDPVRKALWGGRDLTMSECLRVRVIDSLDEMGDDHKEWINAMVAERLYFAAQPEPRIKVMGQIDFDAYGW